MIRLNLIGLPYKGQMPLRDVVVKPAIDKGEDVIIYCGANGKFYELSNEELKNPIRHIIVPDYKHGSDKIHKLLYYPLHETQ